MRAVVLIGMMGCGKSTVGLRAAKQVGWSFVDLDEEIEREAADRSRRFLKRKAKPDSGSGKRRRCKNGPVAPVR